MALILFDVGEEIHMDRLRRTSEVRQAGGALKHPAPEYAGFQRPPVIQDCGEHNLASGERLRTRIKFYDYGVVSILFETFFEGNWNQWIELASRWMASADFERSAYELARGQTERLGSAVVKPYSQWLSEDYFLFHVAEMPGSPLASDLIMHCGDQIAQIVRGETSFAREGARLQRVTLDVTELTERAENAIKFLSDMFAARLYNLAATKVGVNDYKSLVDQKLKTAGNLYNFMIGEFHQARAFVLEVMVVIILVIELIFLFRAKS